MNAAAHHRIDVHVKFGVLCQQLQLLVQDLQTLLGNVVRSYVVHADLHVLETGPIQSPDTVGRQQVPVGDHAGDCAAAADVGDDLLDIRMQHGLAAKIGRAHV